MYSSLFGQRPSFFQICSIALLAAACESKPPEPESRQPDPAPQAIAKQVETTAAAAKKQIPSRISPDDPLRGQFSLADATADLKGSGALVAKIETSLGVLSCELYEDKAPITVANFVGLARGLRPFKDQTGKWVKRAGYDGTTFHRVIRGFMIQGGDPLGTGAGEPGYVIPDEIWPQAEHDQRGLLCMANRGPHTNGMQFFILDGPAPHLDKGYTIFGKCGPETVIEKIASVDVKGDQAVKPPQIKTIKISRGS